MPARHGENQRFMDAGCTSFTATVKKNLARNDRCHCGSGRKYKACCLALDEAAARAARAEVQERAAARACTAGCCPGPAAFDVNTAVEAMSLAAR
jgi:hypothetical protein